MKSFLVAGLALIASANVAVAADLGPTWTGWPFEAPPAFPTTRMYDWSGFYVGLNAGGALGSDGSGGLLGGTAGYNLQTGERFVVSLEGDFDWSGISGMASAPSCSYGGSDTCDLRIPWLADARLRLGYSLDAFTPVAIMPYVTGGVAVARLNADIVGAPYGTVGSNNLGWTVGTGVEVAITGDWRAKVEYLYMDFNGCISSCVFPPSSPAPLSVNYTASVIRVGVNYRLWRD
jgi:outer membrane immunogenic protein